MRAESVPEALWPQISALIAQTMGLHFPPERRTDLERGLTGAATELGFESPAACANWLLSTPLAPAQLHTLASHLTIGETYFFRERKTFQALESRVIPHLVRRCHEQRRLRVWSAACATGEEPYSLAILLRQLLPEYRTWNVKLLATDINGRFLKKAAEGLYSDWSFRDTSPEFRERYFSRTSQGRYAILPEIRDSVTFTQLNLVQDGFPSLATDTNAMDLIFCRNVLIYFTPQQTATLVEKLRQALVPEGWLAVSPSECSHTVFAKFASENFPGAILYRRSEERGAAAWNMPAPLLPPAPIAPFAFSPPPAAITPPMATPKTNPVVHPPADRARALANEGKLAEARLESARWIEAAKLEPAAHYLHAMVSQELGDHAQARQSLQRALYLEPEFVLAHFALGNLARDEGRGAQAEKHFRNALRLLKALPPEAQLAESDGLTAGRLSEIVDTLLALPRSAA